MAALFFSRSDRVLGSGSQVDLGARLATIPVELPRVDLLKDLTLYHEIGFFSSRFLVPRRNNDVYIERGVPTRFNNKMMQRGDPNLFRALDASDRPTEWIWGVSPDASSSFEKRALSIIKQSTQYAPIVYLFDQTGVRPSLTLLSYTK